MMNINRIVLVFSVVLTLNLWANDGFRYPNDNKGFWISSDNLSKHKAALKNGDSVKFSGEICLVKWGEKKGKDRCHKISKEKIEFKAFFPDNITEITNSLKLSYSKSRKRWEYEFTTDTLKSKDVNQFTIIIGSARKRSIDLLKIQAKLVKRLILLNEI